MPTHLPSNPFPVDTTEQKAYDVCLAFERCASDSGPSPSALVCARILGYMLIHAPVQTGRYYIAGKVVECANDTALRKLGEFYYDHFVCLCEYSSKSDN